MNNIKEQGRNIENFYPLIGVFIAIVLGTRGHLMRRGEFSPMWVMNDFMGVWFLVFGLMKLTNISGFASAYASYDIIAKRWKNYGYVYPFIELGLAALYLGDHSGTYMFIATTITIIVMAVSIPGVWLALAQKRKIQCACIGVIFKLPMTWVTISENILMLFMAILMAVTTV